MQEFLTPEQFAKAANVSRSTVSNWIRKNKLKVHRNSVNNRIFISSSELTKLDLKPQG